VAPHRGRLAAGSRETRLQLLDRFWPALAGEAWEELCRRRLPRLAPSTRLAELGPWGPASRWWQGNQPEWDVVGESLDGERLLLGETKWSAGPFGKEALSRACRELAAKPPPSLPGKLAERRVVRGLFVPELSTEASPEDAEDVVVVTASSLC